MRARILQNAAAQCKPSDQKKPARVTVLRRFAALAACLAVLLAGAVALPRLISRPAQKEEAETMIANGMEELSSRDELSAAVGFPVKAAMSLPFFPQEIHYTSYWGDMAQTDYANGSAGACLPRQSVGAGGSFRRLERIPRAADDHRRRLHRHAERRNRQLHACHLDRRQLQLLAQSLVRSAGKRLADDHRGVQK